MRHAYGAAVDIERPGRGRRALLLVLAIAHLAWAGLVGFFLFVSFTWTECCGPPRPTPKDLLAIALVVATLLTIAAIARGRLGASPWARWFVIGMTGLNAALAAALIIESATYRPDPAPRVDPAVAAMDPVAVASNAARNACMLMANRMQVEPPGTTPDAEHHALVAATTYADEARRLDPSWTELHDALIALPPRIRASPNYVQDGFERVTKECQRRGVAG